MRLVRGARRLIVRHMTDRQTHMLATHGAAVSRGRPGVTEQTAARPRGFHAAVTARTARDEGLVIVGILKMDCCLELMLPVVLYKVCYNRSMLRQFILNALVRSFGRFWKLSTGVYGYWLSGTCIFRNQEKNC